MSSTNLQWVFTHRYSQTNCWVLEIPENREFKKWKLTFFHGRHGLSISLEIFVVTYRVTIFCQNWLTCYYYLLKKLNFHFFFSPIFGLCPEYLSSSRLTCSSITQYWSWAGHKRIQGPGPDFPPPRFFSKPAVFRQNPPCWANFRLRPPWGWNSRWAPPDQNPGSAGVLTLWLLMPAEYLLSSWNPHRVRWPAGIRSLSHSGFSHIAWRVSACTNQNKCA